MIWPDGYILGSVAMVEDPRTDRVKMALELVNTERKFKLVPFLIVHLGDIKAMDTLSLVGVRLSLKGWEQISEYAGKPFLPDEDDLIDCMMDIASKPMAQLQSAGEPLPPITFSALTGEDIKKKEA